MKVFVATSFSTQVDERGNVGADFRREVEAVINVLRAAGYEVKCAVEAEDWKIKSTAADSAVTEDMNDIDNADALVALLNEVPSPGAQFEIGYAVKAGKRVVLVPRPGSELRWFNQGLVEAGVVILASPVDVVKILSKS